MHVIVIGGGLGGLALTLALHNTGISVHCYESDPTFSHRRQGYGLTIQQACSALRKLGILDKVKQVDTPSYAHYLFESKGHIEAFFGSIFVNGSAAGDVDGVLPSKRLNLHIPRQKLRDLLLQQIPPELVSWGKRFSGKWKQLPGIDGVQVEFTDGSSAIGDLVVGADGIYSQVRQSILSSSPSGQSARTSATPLRYLGVIVALGIVTTDHPLTVERVFQTVGPDGTRIFVMPFTEKEAMWQLSFPMESLQEAQTLCSDIQRIRHLIFNKVREWHPPVPEMLESTRDELFMASPVYDRDPLETDGIRQAVGHSVPITLIGDACHPMSPFKGQGANQALLDAVKLADSISLLKLPISDMLQAFEKEMIDRTRQKVLASRSQVSILHSPQAHAENLRQTRGIERTVVDELRLCGITAHSSWRIDELICDILLQQQRQQQRETE